MTRWIAPALLATAVAACSSSKPTGATGTGATGTGGETSSAASTTSSSGAGGTTASSSGASGTTASSASSSSSSSTSTGTGGGSTSSDAGADGGLTGWTLVWSDEFNAPDGTGVDTTKWAAQIGGDGWGNQELEYYTNDLANAQQKGGNLVITATTAGAAAHTCSYPGGACKYTSARLQTMGLFEQAYGRFEARIKLPRGQGLWPAFWMLGNNINTVNWPTCGEIDIMENIGKEPGINHGSMHGPGYSGGSALTGSYTLPGGASFADGFHLFALEWEAGVARFYVDTTLYETKTTANVPAGKTWVYDHPFFILLNVAVGGTFPGAPDATTVFPQTMLVDYVRVYKKG